MNTQMEPQYPARLQRAEVSGWDGGGRFFVERTAAQMDGRTMVVDLLRPMARNAVLFVRLLQPDGALEQSSRVMQVVRSRRHKPGFRAYCREARTSRKPVTRRLESSNRGRTPLKLAAQMAD